MTTSSETTQHLDTTDMPDPIEAPAVALDHSDSGAPEIEADDLAARAPVTEQNPTFAELGVREETVRALEKVGIVRTFAIQELTLKLAMDGNDLIGQARTGTGKTLGFGVPMLQQIKSKDEGGDGTPQALVIVPTRELCVQVSRDIATAGSERNIRVQAIYGGRAYEPQVEALRNGVDIVVGTPGRLIDLAEQQKLVLGKISILVLDEADEMLDLGFLPDIEKILRILPEKRQTMLFSATMPGPIVTLARTMMTQPTHIRAENHDDLQTAPSVKQHVYRAHAMDKTELLSRVLQVPDRGLTLIFTRTKRTAQNVADNLVDRGFAAAAVHGDLGQGAREQALRAFRSGKVDVLVATDVAARGLDISGVSHVVNYQAPEDEKTYVHRIGRTGRAGAEGIAVTLVDWDDMPRWALIDKALGLNIPEPVETYSTSPHLYEELGIPTTATGRLPRSRRTREGLDSEKIEDIGGRPPRTSRDRGPDRGQGRGRAGHSDDGPAKDEQRPSKPRSGAPRRRTRGAKTPANGQPTGNGVSAGTDNGAQSSTGQTDGTGRRRRARRRRPASGDNSSGGNATATTAS